MQLWRASRQDGVSLRKRFNFGEGFAPRVCKHPARLANNQRRRQEVFRCQAGAQIQVGIQDSCCYVRKSPGGRTESADSSGTTKQSGELRFHLEMIQLATDHGFLNALDRARTQWGLILVCSAPSCCNPARSCTQVSHQGELNGANRNRVIGRNQSNRSAARTDPKSKVVRTVYRVQHQGEFRLSTAEFPWFAFLRVEPRVGWGRNRGVSCLPPPAVDLPSGAE